MRAVEYVSVPTATGDRGDLAPVEADGYLVGDLWLRRCGGFGHCAAEVKSCRDTKEGR